MKKSIGLVSGLLVIMFSSSAFADEPKVETISFEDDRIEGELMMPDSGNIKAREMDELTSLINAREDFVDEMRKTVEEL